MMELKISAFVYSISYAIRLTRYSIVHLHVLPFALEYKGENQINIGFRCKSFSQSNAYTWLFVELRVLLISQLIVITVVMWLKVLYEEFLVKLFPDILIGSITILLHSIMYFFLYRTVSYLSMTCGQIFYDRLHLFNSV